MRGAAKREAILTAAWEVFREVGYAQASMDEITRRAGGSKMSLYSHFGSKERLFEAVVELQAETISMSLPAAGSFADIEQLLNALAAAWLNSITGATLQDLHRVALSAGMEGAPIGKLLYERGTAQVLHRLAQVLDREMQSGRLVRDDPAEAAEAFLGLLLGTGYIRFALGVPERMTAAARQRRGANAVRIFLAAYRPSASAARKQRGATTTRAKRPVRK